MSSKRREASKSPNAKSSLDGKAEDSNPSPYSRRRTEPAKKQAEHPGQSESPQPGQSSSSVQTSSLNVSPMQKLVENITGAKKKVFSKFKLSPKKGALCPTVGLDFKSEGPSASSNFPRGASAEDSISSYRSDLSREQPHPSSLGALKAHVMSKFSPPSPAASVYGNRLSPPECRSGAPFFSRSSERHVHGASSHSSTHSSPQHKTGGSKSSSAHSSPHRKTEGSTPSSGHLSPHRVAERSMPSSGHLSPHRVAERSKPSSGHLSPHRVAEGSTPSSGHLSPHRVAEGSMPSSGHLSPHRVAGGNTPSSRRSSHLEMISFPDARSAGSSPSRATLNIDTYQTSSNPCSSMCLQSQKICRISRCNQNLCENCTLCNNHCWQHCRVTCHAHCEIHAPVNNSNYGCIQRTLYQGGQTSSERSSRLQEVHLGQGGTVDSALGRSPGTSSSGAVGPINTVCRSRCTDSGLGCLLIDCLKPGSPCVRCCRECPLHCQKCCRATCSVHCSSHYDGVDFGNPCKEMTN